MPVRDEAVKPAYEPKQDVLELSFLPENLQKKIEQIFDSYFGFGYKSKIQTIDEETVPHFPNQISSLDSGQIGDIQSKFTAWYAYSLEKLRYVAVAASVVEGEIEDALNRAIVDQIGSKATVEEKKSKAKTAPEYVALLSYKSRLTNLKDMLDSSAKSYDKSIATISREISRREKSMEF